MKQKKLRNVGVKLKTKLLWKRGRLELQRVLKCCLKNKLGGGGKQAGHFDLKLKWYIRMKIWKVNCRFIFF